tara:strand:+ start:503 stop:1435 length:933 start_codon:yes stop_codon:yes gene_type:complete
MVSTTRRISQCPPTADFSSGSIVPYLVADDGSLCFALGREAITADDWCEQLKWTAIGGSCKPSDLDVEETASREFYEECMGLPILGGGDPLSIRARLNRHVPTTVHMVTEKNNQECIHAYFFVRARENTAVDTFADEFADRRTHLLNLKAVADAYRIERTRYQRVMDHRFILGTLLTGTVTLARVVRNGREVLVHLPPAVDPAELTRHLREYDSFVAAMQMEPDVNVQLRSITYIDASGEKATFVNDVRVPGDVLELQELRFFSEHELMQMIEEHVYIARRRFRQRLINLVRFALPIFRRRRLQFQAGAK